MRSRVLPKNVKWYSERIKPRGARRRASPQQIVGLRLHDLARLFRSRYGVMLPDDDSGLDDIDPVIHHIAALSQPARRAEHWLELWAPWLTLAEKRDIITKGIAGARPWTADQLAWRYKVTREERTMIGLTTIGAIDYAKAARTKRRKERDRKRKAIKRQASGVKPRAEYLAASTTHKQPWKAEGISRRTWYRRRGTGPATA